MALIGSLLIDLVANTGQMNNNLAKAEKNLASVGGRMNRTLARVDKGMAKVGGAARAMGAAIAAAGAVAFVNKTLESADALAKQADRIGISTKALQQWRFAAGQSGIATGKLDGAFKTFGKRFGELKSGTGALSSFLNKLDPEFAKVVAGASSSDQAIKMIMDRMAQMGSASDRAALSAAAFSKAAGVDMVSLVSGGSEALDGLLNSAATIDDGLLRSAENANDAVGRLTNSLSVIGATIALSIAPAIADFADLLAEYLPPAINLVREGFSKLLEFLSPVTEWMESIGVPIEEVGAIFAGVFGAGGIAVVAIGLFGAALAPLIAAAGPLALFAAAVTAVVLAVKNWDQIVEWAERTYEGIKTWLVDRFNAIVESIHQKVMAVVGFFRDMYDAVVGNSWVPDMIDGIEEHFGRLDKVMVEPAMEANAAIEKSFGDTANAIDGVFKNALDRAGSMISDFVQTGKFELEDFANFAMDILKQLAEQILTTGGNGGFGGGMFGGGGGGFGGIFSSILGGVFNMFGGGGLVPSSFASMPLAGGFARGGRVSPGEAHIVGEKRAEIFVPDTAGKIEPSVGAGQMVFAPQTTINMNGGGSGGGDGDAEMADNLVRKIDQMMEQKMAEFTIRQSRPGGMMRGGRSV